MDDKKKESPEIKVVDKRHSSADESQKEDSPIILNDNDSGLHDVSFANLILSLAGSAQMSLGIAPNPFTQKVEKDLNQAKQTIDLLGVLEKKTQGNLSTEEASLIKVILSDLRMRFVEEKSKK